MNKVFTYTLVALFSLTSLVGAKPGHGPHPAPHPHPVPHPQPHPIHPVHPHPHPFGPKHNLGKFYNGKHYNHWCFHKNWKGWSKTFFYATLGVTVYWVASQGCWYQYYQA